MKKNTLTLLLFSILFQANSALAVKTQKIQTSRVSSVIVQDTTERLENIKELNQSIRSLRLQLKTLDIALEDAKKVKSRKKIYSNTKRYSDAISALTTLGGAIGAVYMEDKIKLLKYTSMVFGVSQGVSVLASLAADMAEDEAEHVQLKIKEITVILKATEKNLELEENLLCKSEPSNQMCK